MQYQHFSCRIILMKKILIAIIVLVILGVGVYVYTAKNNDSATENGRVGDISGEQTDDKLKAATFSGKLEEVNTGCFADAECFVVVNGKHVTTTIGWSRDTVGSIQGVPSFGDLEAHIGEEVEVYAQDKGDGTYTLYGSEGFYVKLK